MWHIVDSGGIKHSSRQISRYREGDVSTHVRGFVKPEIKKNLLC